MRRNGQLDAINWLLRCFIMVGQCCPFQNTPVGIGGSISISCTCGLQPLKNQGPLTVWVSEKKGAHNLNLSQFANSDFLPIVFITW